MTHFSQGINAKFTQKLYEWEERRGIAPESSTLALLNENMEGNGEGDKKGTGDKGSDVTTKSYSLH